MLPVCMSAAHAALTSRMLPSARPSRMLPARACCPSACPLRMLPVGMSVAHVSLGMSVAHATVGTSAAHVTVGMSAAHVTVAMSVVHHDDGHRALSCTTALRMPRLRVFVCA